MKKFIVIFLFLFSTLVIYSQETTSGKQNEYSLIPKNGNTYVVAHRGVHIGIPENTLAAYQKAIDLGCDFVEIDIRKTKDGRFVSVHNSTLEAYTEGKFTGKVNDYRLAEWNKIIGWGTDGIQTDNPEKLIEYLKNRKH